MAQSELPLGLATSSLPNDDTRSQWSSHDYKGGNVRYHDGELSLIARPPSKRVMGAKTPTNCK